VYYQRPVFRNLPAMSVEPITRRYAGQVADGGMTADITVCLSAGWTDPPHRLSLGTDEVHVWRALLRQAEPRTDLLRWFLAADERERAEAYRFRRDREQFITARALLRLLLGSYLDCSPDELRFRYGLYGKPYLIEEQGGGGREILFSVSRSGGLALFAVTRGKNVGIDVERVRFDLDYERIADRFFSRKEVTTLRRLPADYMRREAFFTCWTRKEAYVKAIGKGLSCSLDRFSVSLMPGEQAALLEAEGDPGAASRWSLRDIGARSDYAASLAVEARGRQLRCFQCPEPGADGFP